MAKQHQQQVHLNVYVPREQFTHDIQESFDHERKADELERLGKHNLAVREYQKSLELEERCLGKHHPVVEEFRHKLEIPQDGPASWKRTAHRHSAELLTESFQHEREGDILHKLGFDEKAKHEYDRALNIETHVVGKHHPMVIALKEKMILERIK
ncbi:expressed tetratricopeptide repeat protein [Nitzschia inconspicua]|uniref:Expressed tetratricopeptide repeat protein n=1 Tax=Nitzschia inconspicua TaxID=303405 RepID=A0A9K3LS92_9STRA|nr:expressed tetratricopeptide repeat protein [Nitzschia inconspicua]